MGKENRASRIPANQTGAVRGLEGVSKKDIDSLFRIVRRNKTPEGVWMAISKRKLAATQRRFAALASGRVDAVRRATTQYYSLERQAIVYEGILNGSIRIQPTPSTV